MIVLEGVKCAFIFVCSILVVTFLWKSKNIELAQKESIYKILLGISDRNCQSCTFYFKNLLSTVVKCKMYAKMKENSADFVMKNLV